MENTQKRSVTFGDFIVTLFLIIVAGGFAVMVAIQFGWVPPLWFGPGLDAPQVQTAPTIQVVRPPAVQQQPVQAPAAPAPAVVPTAYIPAVQQVQFEPAPPASMPVEDVQPRVEVVEVQRSEEQTTIIRTVPNKPSGPPIVIDGGKKCRGVCR